MSNWKDEPASVVLDFASLLVGRLHSLQHSTTERWWNCRNPLCVEAQEILPTPAQRDGGDNGA